MEANQDELLQKISELLDDKVGFIGPFLMKQQLKWMDMDGKRWTPEDYYRLSNLLKAAVESLFGKKNANNIQADIKHIIPHREVNADKYPNLG